MGVGDKQKHFFHLGRSSDAIAAATHLGGPEVQSLGLRPSRHSTTTGPFQGVGLRVEGVFARV